MKKIIGALLMLIFSLLTAIGVFAANIEILCPSETEQQISPTRDFYVIGSIKRDDSANITPLNIKVELFDSEGNIVRTVTSNVESDGVTSNQYILLDYIEGYAYNDQKGVNMNNFPAPDLVYDGNERDSIRQPYRKMVVREGYFAAIIYGGATKENNLSYNDEYEQPLSDLTEGTYILKVTAFDLNKDEVCTSERKISIGNVGVRLIYNRDDVDKSDINDIALSNEYTVTDSIVGYWRPYRFVSAPTNFSYMISSRYLENLRTEFAEVQALELLLYSMNFEQEDVNAHLGSALNSGNKTEIGYLYYDIGEPSVSFEFGNNKFTHTGSIVELEKNKAVKITRVETVLDDENTYMDFSSDDGLVMLEGAVSSFYGVFSPLGLSANPQNGGSSYSIRQKVNSMKAIIENENGLAVYESDVLPYVVKQSGDNLFNAQGEFVFEITPKEDMISDSLTLQIVLYDSAGKILAAGDRIPVAIKKSGQFVGGYNRSYWGKSFCDTINLFGTTSSEDVLNPDDKITRGDFAALVNRLFGFSRNDAAEFSDIDSDSSYYSDIATAFAVNYMAGDEHSRMKADEPITREQAMIILSRLSEVQEGNAQISFADEDDISFWAKDEVSKMCSTGIISGFDGYLHPQESITAAEAAALILKTVFWMNDAEEKSVQNEPSVPVSVDTNLSDIELSNTDKAEIIDETEVEAYLRDNLAAFENLKNYIIMNCTDGIYVQKVGAGLDVRDYKLGKAIYLSDDAVNLLMAFSQRYDEFSLKYNPSKDNSIYFTLGYTDLVEVGISFSLTGESTMRDMELIFGNWYYYKQK